MELQYSNEDHEQILQKTSSDINVLKHLPAALDLLEGNSGANRYLHQPKCSFYKPLNILPKYLKCTPESSSEQHKVSMQKLGTKQDILDEFSKIKGMGNNENFNKITQLATRVVQQVKLPQSLYNVYLGKTPIYSRLSEHVFRGNFANVLIALPGIQLQTEGLRKRSYLPSIRVQENSQYKNKQVIQFDSNFESGNLLYVYQSVEDERRNEYDLILQNDINTKGHNQWFYFRVYVQMKSVKVRFNIINFIKDTSLFSYGMQPLTFSCRMHEKHGAGWMRTGCSRVKYERNNIRRDNKETYYYTLSFEYYFRENDCVYFAPNHPYSYSQMIQYLESIIKNPTNKSIFSIKILGETLGKNVVNLLSISNQNAHSRCVWIIARQHSGETTSSFILQGIVDYLLKCMKSGDPFYHQYTFKIIPMVNVDGVIHGNTRSQITGLDPNRIWSRPLKKLSPIIYTLKKLILKTKGATNFVLDLHSHSKKPGCFFYGNCSLSDPKIAKLYPSIVCQGDPRFAYKSCRFRGGYTTTARKVLYEQLKIPFIYTLQCSLIGYYNNNRIREYEIRDYYEMGMKLMSSYFKLDSMKGTDQEIKKTYQIEDIYQAESAKSQSSLSDEEYQNIIKPIKTRAKSIRPKKIRQDKVSYSKPILCRPNRKASEKENKTLKHKDTQPKNNAQNRVQKVCNEKSAMLPKQMLSKENQGAQSIAFKIQKNKRSILPSKLLNKVSQAKDEHKKSARIQFRDKEADKLQGQEANVVWERIREPRKKSHLLCVLGSSLEEDRMAGSQYEFSRPEETLKKWS